MKIIDLTQTFTKDMPVYPGDPKPSLKQVASLDKDGYNDHEIATVMHVGTHMDAPLHMIEGGKRIDEIPTDKLIGPGVLLDARDKIEINANILLDRQIKKGSIVLVYTGFGIRYRTKDYFKNYPHFGNDFAEILVELGISAVGMDMLGPDLDTPWSTHKILLGKEIMILENLINLDQLLEEEEFEVFALPAKFKTDAAPVRVIAIIK